MKRTELNRSSPDKIREWQQRGAKAWADNRRRRRRTQGVDAEVHDPEAVRVLTIRRAAGQCEAHGLHAPTCTLDLEPRSQHVHHIWPTEHGGPDLAWNTMLVHPDCHLGRIHARWGTDRGLGDLAVKLGFLWVEAEPWDHGDRWRPWEAGD